MPKLNRLILVNLICGFALPATVFAANSDSGVAEKVVAYTKNGKLYKYELYLGNTNTPAIVNVKTAEAIPNDVQKITYSSLEDFHNNKHVSANKMQAAGSPAKIAFGYVPSIQALYVGVGPDACYNSNPTVDRGPSMGYQSKLAITSSDANNSSIMSNDTSVSAGFEGFHSKVSNTYSHNYAGSLTTGDYNLSAALATVINTGIRTGNELSENGKAMLEQDPTQFFKRCGTAAVAAYVGGILTTVNIKVLALTHTAATSFSNTVAAGWGPDQVSNAFKSAKDNAQEFAKITFNIKTFGNIKFSQAQNGAIDYDTYIDNAIDANKAYLTKCEATPKPDLSSCATFMSNLSTAVTTGMGYAKAALSYPPAGEDSSSFGADTLYLFANGINLTHNNPSNTSITYKNPRVGGDQNGSPYALTYAPIPGASDPFLDNNIIQPLKNSIKLIYQLNALSARASLLASLPGMTTDAEKRFLNNMASYYAQDSKEIYATSYACYQSIFSSDTSSTAACSKNLSVATGELKYKFDNLPGNVYQLYRSNVIAQDSIQELLFKNTMALQYDVDFTEKATGVTGAGKDGCNPCFMRSGNQMSFGLAFYNRALYSDEFFGGLKTPARVLGYIFPNTVIPIMGNTPNEYTNTNIGGTRDGVRYWTLEKSEKAIPGIRNYMAAPLYFAFNDEVLPYADDNFTIAAASHPYDCPSITDAPNGVVACGIFNKVIGNNTVTGDSSANHTIEVPIMNGGQVVGGETVAKKLSLLRHGEYSKPRLSDYINGKNIPGFAYTYEGMVTTKNSSNKKAENCFAGVYLPNLEYPGSGKVAVFRSKTVYGSTEKVKYFCNRNTDVVPDKNSWTYFELVNGKSAGAVKNIEQSAKFSFSHISSFFGVKS